MSEPADPLIRKTVSLPASLWQRIEDFQFENRIKRDTEAVRTLVQRGLDGQAAPRRSVSTAVGAVASRNAGPNAR